MFVVRDLWTVTYCAELLDQMNKRVEPYFLNNKGTDREALDGLAADRKATIARHGCN
jgi:hypothetical protein